MTLTVCCNVPSNSALISTHSLTHHPSCPSLSSASKTVLPPDGSIVAEAEGEAMSFKAKRKVLT